VHDLSPLTALGATRARVDTHASVTCTEMPDVALASFTARLGSEQAARAVLQSVTGATPAGPGRSTIGDIGALWMGPDQWLLVAPINTHEDLAQQLVGASKGVASVTEQTDAWARFDMAGDGVLSVLELLCAANTRSMSMGDATRTSIHHLGCFVQCLAPDRFAIYGPRASAGSLHHAIVTAMHAAL